MSQLQGFGNTPWEQKKGVELTHEYTETTHIAWHRIGPL